jgi:hypothetical protein
MDGFLTLLKGYQSQADIFLAKLYTYCTAEVISNSLDALAFLLVTPEFLPLRRRKHFESVAGRLASAIEPSTMKGPVLIAHWILVSPILIVVMGKFAFFARDVVRSYTGSLPFGWRLAIGFYFLAILLLAGAGFFWYGGRADKDDEDPPYRLASLIVLLITAVVFLDSLHIPIPSVAYDLARYGMYVSLIWIIILGLGFMVSSVLSRVGRHTLFWVGVLLFFLSRGVNILHSIGKVHGD